MDFLEGLDKYFKANFLIKNQNEEILDISHTGSSYYRFYSFIKENNFNRPYELNFNKSDSLGLLVFLLKICKDVLSELNASDQFESIYNIAKQNIIFYQNNNSDILVSYDCEKYLIVNDEEISEYAKIRFDDCFDKIKKLLIGNFLKGDTLEEKTNNLYELNLKYENINIKFAIKLMLLQLKIDYDVEFDKYINNLIEEIRDCQDNVCILKFLDDNDIKKELYLKNAENNTVKNVSINDVTFKDDELIIKENKININEFDLKFEYLFNEKEKIYINPDLKNYLKNPYLEDGTKVEEIQNFFAQYSNRKFFLKKFRDINKINEYNKLHIVATYLNSISCTNEIEDTYSYFAVSWDSVNINYRKSINEYIQNNYNTNEDKLNLLLSIFSNNNIKNNDVKYLLANYIINEYYINLNYIFNKDIRNKLLFDSNSDYYILYKYLYNFGFVDNINIVSVKKIFIDAEMIKEEEENYVLEKKMKLKNDNKKVKESTIKVKEKLISTKEDLILKSEIIEEEEERIREYPKEEFKKIGAKDVPSKLIEINLLSDVEEYVNEKSEALKIEKVKEEFNEKVKEKLISYKNTTVDFRGKNRINSIVANNPQRLEYTKYQYGSNKITGISNSLKNTFTTAGGYITKENLITFAERYIDSDFKNIYDHININVVKGLLSKEEQNEVKIAITKNIMNEIIPVLKEKRKKEEEIDIIQQENNKLITEKKELDKKSLLYDNMELKKELNNLEEANRELDEMIKNFNVRNDTINSDFNTKKEELDRLNRLMSNRNWQIIENTNKYIS